MAAREPAGQRCLRGVLRDRRHRAHRPQQHDREPAQLTRGEAEQLDRSVVGPVQVIDCEHDRLHGARFGDQTADAVEHAKARFGGHARVACRVRGGARVTEQARQLRIGLAASHCDERLEDLQPWPKRRRARRVLAVGVEHHHATRATLVADRLKQAGLADASIALKHDALPSSSTRGLDQRCELGGHMLATDQPARRRWLQVTTRHGRNEAIPAAVDCLDELPVLVNVAEQLPQDRDVLWQHRFDRALVRPDIREQLLFRHQRAAMRDEIVQHSKHTAPYRHWLPVAQQHAVALIELEASKLPDHYDSRV